MTEKVETSPFTGEPPISSPFKGLAGGMQPVTNYILQENGDRIILEDNSGFMLTEMAM